MKPHNVLIRWMLGISCMLSLLIFFLFQRTDFAVWVGIEEAVLKFIYNKSFRFLINDFLMIGVIYSIFGEKKYVIFALWVQVVGIIFILFPYFLLKLVWHTGNGPLISFLHRLVVNPILLLLLIPSFYLLENKKN